jgi:hypothetical protein
MIKVGDLVQSIESLTDECRVGLVVKLFVDQSGYEEEKRGGMILWDHGEVCYFPEEELEVISESRRSRNI